MLRLLGVLCCSCLLTCQAAVGLDHVSFQRDGKSKHVSGRVVVEAQDGGLLVLDATRRLWAVTPDELEERREDSQPFESLGPERLAAELLRELPDGFGVHVTKHYVVCYNTSSVYAHWCGALFERLYRAFHNYWGQRGLELADPEWPLVALVFDSKRAFSAYARAELGDATSSIIGYYSLRTNRVTTFDLTGADVQTRRISSAAQINRILARPAAERTVATIIHEATHQLAFNCGLHERYADIPLWLSEGLAIYFETPDLRNGRGWRSIGSVNRVRLADFRRYLSSRPADSLRTLLNTDDRFRNARTAAHAYGEAWALNYYLIKKHKREFAAYLEVLSRKKPLLYDEPHERIDEFKQFFGADLQQLDREFLRFMRTVR